MILQEQNYIAKQKKKYLIPSILLTTLVFGIFGMGLMITKTRANLFTVSACIVAIGAALFITRFISFSRYKDGNSEIAQMIEQLNSGYDIFHSAIVPHTKGTGYFEHVVVTAEKIYFIAYTKQQVEQYGIWVQEVLSEKGIMPKHLCFLVAKDANQMKSYMPRIEKNAVASESYSQKVSEILM